MNCNHEICIETEMIETVLAPTWARHQRNNFLIHWRHLAYQIKLQISKIKLDTLTSLWTSKLELMSKVESGYIGEETSKMSMYGWSLSVTLERKGGFMEKLRTLRLNGKEILLLSLGMTLPIFVKRLFVMSLLAVPRTLTSCDTSGQTKRMNVVSYPCTHLLNHYHA